MNLPIFEKYNHQTYVIEAVVSLQLAQNMLVDDLLSMVAPLNTKVNENPASD